MYKDFRGAVLDILGAQENQEALLNGVVGMGHGVDDIPGSIVSVSNFFQTKYMFHVHMS